MKNSFLSTILKICSGLGLILTFLPSLLVFNGIIGMKTHFTLMIAGLVLWFGSAPFWMESKSLEEKE